MDKEEMKQRPNCGESIPVEAKQSQFCKELLSESKTEVSTECTDINLVTHEPGMFDKIMQVYWANPKSWLLNEFRVSQGIIYISTMNGNSISAPVSECEFSYHKDNNERTEFYVQAGEEKLHFKEMPGMLEEAEWKIIKDFILVSCKAKLSKLGHVTNALKFVKKLLSSEVE